jgi:hypothetical protein
LGNWNWIDDCPDDDENWQHEKLNGFLAAASSIGAEFWLSCDRVLGLHSDM